MNPRQVKITLYRWAGSKFFLEIRSGCEECDSSVQVIRDLLQTEFRCGAVVFETKNWLDNLFECLLHGGWHAPVILLNGKLFSQGVIPDRKQLSDKIWQRLQQTHPICPICRKVVLEEGYSKHRRSETKQRIIRFIQQDHPEWVEPGGVCSQCLRSYEEKLKKGDLIT